MPSTSTQARRTRILAEARGLLSRGERPTVVEIASASGVSKGAFYREFPSRTALIDELRLDPEPDARDRLLRSALELIGSAGLAALSMDEVASAAGVSRATLYRLFPGKPALFVGVVRAFSPLEAVTQAVAEMFDQTPETVMPHLARTVHRVVAGPEGPGLGLLRAVFVEVSSFTPEAAAAAREVASAALSSVGMYVAHHMAAGSLRPMHPMLALQAFIGPIFFHLLTRPMVEQLIGLDLDGEQAVTELAEAWLRAMKPEPPGGGTHE